MQPASSQKPVKSLEEIWNVHDAQTVIPAGGQLLAYLLTVDECTVVQERGGNTAGGGQHSGFNFYFVDQSGRSIRLTQKCQPYLLVAVKERFATVKCGDLDSILFHVQSVLSGSLSERFPNAVIDSSITSRVVTRGSTYLQKGSTPHRKTLFLRFNFSTEESLRQSRQELQGILRRNVELEEKWRLQLLQSGSSAQDDILEVCRKDPTYLLNDVLEADIDSASRMFITTSYRCARWYNLLKIKESHEIQITLAPEQAQTNVPRLVVLAWDIETYKDPLKFPNSAKDPIMCISYMTQHSGWLLVNREHFGRDIRDFRYQPTGEYGGDFRVYNFDDEKSLLSFFLHHVASVVRPHIIVSYNGDGFDFPYTQERMARHGLIMKDLWGFEAREVRQGQKPEYHSNFVLHMDCLKWVERDSYLPCGSRGLKAVTRTKLHYEPREVDPELMTPYARSRPQIMAEYSVSDAVATYFLYRKYVHQFILALSSIIPMKPDDVLRKGSGTLCEQLLMAEAYKREVCIPNRSVQELEKWHDKYLLVSETYVGGQVEQLRSGIFRSDIPEKFDFESDIIDHLIENLDNSFHVWWSREINENGAMKLDRSNWSEVKEKIQRRLQFYRDSKTLTIEPLIYHMDVGAMYPNIILSQRIQPYAIVQEADCDDCAYSKDCEACRRPLNWRWKAERFPIKQADVQTIKDQLAVETHKVGNEKQGRKWADLSANQRHETFMERVKQLSRHTTGGKFKIPCEDDRVAMICERASAFYVDTIRDFRDRRLVYKGMKKKAEREAERCSLEEREAAHNKVVLWDSLQLAHKCILNSFYGYVMRKGARWYSMESAAVITYTGAQIINRAKQICNGIGSPLELDTDGVWTLIPRGFPDKYEIELWVDGKEEPIKRNFSYPCWMLNAEVERIWLNEQYHFFDQASRSYEVSSENSVLFEIDGPYKAMFLPASEKEDQQLKKRYAVFDFDDNVVELKGFELKRRGELQIIKMFQEEVFPSFLHGKSRGESYAAVASVAKQWLSFLLSKGRGMSDWRDTVELLSESKTLSKPAISQGAYKSAGITAAHRLTELLDDETYVKDSNVKAEFVLSVLPTGAEKTSRAVPVLVFESDNQQRARFLLKWTSSGDLQNASAQQSILPGAHTGETEGDVALWSREPDAFLGPLLDWDYYRERLGVAIQKIVIIPAIAQGLANPVPQIQLPEWLRRRVDASRGRQRTLQLLIKPKLSKVLDAGGKESVQSTEPPLAGTARWSARKTTDQEPAGRAINFTPGSAKCVAEFVRLMRPQWELYRRKLRLEDQCLVRARGSEIPSEKSTLILLDLEPHTQRDSSGLFWATVKPIDGNRTYRILVQHPRTLYVAGELDNELLKDKVMQLGGEECRVALGSQVATLFGSSTPTILTTISMPTPVVAQLLHLFLDGTLIKGGGESRVLNLPFKTSFMTLIELGVHVKRSMTPWGTVCLEREDLLWKPKVGDLSFALDIIADGQHAQGRYSCIHICIDSLVATRRLGLAATVTHESRRIPTAASLRTLSRHLTRVITHHGDGQEVDISFLGVNLTRGLEGVIEEVTDLSKRTLLQSRPPLAHLLGYPAKLATQLTCAVEDDENLVGSIKPGGIKVMFEMGSLNTTGPVVDREGAVLAKVVEAFTWIYVKGRKSCLYESDLPVAVAWRAALSNLNDTSVLYDINVAKRLLERGEVLHSLCDEGPYRTAADLLERDLLTPLLGGPVTDGTQTKEVARILPNIATCVPRLVVAGVHRDQIIHFRFTRPAALHALLRLPQLAQRFQIPISDSRILTRDRAYFTNKSVPDEKQALGTLQADPTVVQLLFIRETLLKSRLVHAHKESLSWLLDSTATVHDDTWARELFCRWTQLLLRAFVMLCKISISDNLTSDKDGILPVAIWPDGALIKFPTTSPNVAERGAQLLRGRFESDSLFSGLIDPEYLSQYRHGVQLDYRNCIYVDNEGAIGHIALPALNGFPDNLAEKIEALLINFLEEPRQRAANFTGKRHPTRKALSSATRDFIFGEWAGIAQISPAHLEGSELMAFHECIGSLGLARAKVTPVGCANALLMRLTSLDSEFAEADEEIKKDWLEDVNAEQDEGIFEQPYSATIPIVLSHMVCASCHHVECIDLSDRDPVCIKCDQKYSAEAVESRLVTILESAVMAWQARDVVCTKCKRLRQLRTATSCSCGGKFDYQTSEVDLRLLISVLHPVCVVNGLDWLESVVHWVDKMVPS